MNGTRTKDIRKAFLALAEQRALPGGGGEAPYLREPSAHYGTPDLRSVLGDLPYLVVGGFATRLFMPERMTLDLDILVDPSCLTEIESVLISRGGRRSGSLACGGSRWEVPGIGALDVLALETPWLEDAMRHPVPGPGGLPYIGLPYLVLMKLASSRVQDLADIARMLGAAGDEALRAVCDAVRRYRPGDIDDVASMARLGRAECSPRWPEGK